MATRLRQLTEPRGRIGPPDNRTTLVDAAYARLRDEILDNRMPPGFSALESELADRLGMSRTPVREALIRLAKEGLVCVTPRRGMRVLAVSASDMREIYQILATLESEAARTIAARHPCKAEMAPLEQACNAMQAALDQRDLVAWVDADDRFHRAMLDLNDNRRLADFVGTLLDQAHRMRQLTLNHRGNPTLSTQEHHLILEAIARGDVDETYRLFRRHRERAGVELLAVLEQAQPGL